MLHQTRSKAWFVVMTAACALAVAAVVGPLSAQTPKAIGEITGAVIDARSQKPLSGATVSLTLVGQRVPGTGNTTNDDVPAAFRHLNSYTAADGTFRFRPVAVGRYILAVRKPGSPTSYFGQQDSTQDLQFFDIRQDEVVAGVVLRVWPGAAISGTVRTRAGVPVSSRWLRLLEVRNDHGTRRLMPALQDAVVTNDRGEYRFTGLAAGRYLVEAPPNKPRAAIVDRMRMDSSPSSVAPAEFGVAYPTAPWPTDADVIAIGGGEERTRVDMAVPDGPPPAHRVSGRIQGLEFSPLGQKISLVLAAVSNHLPSHLEIASTTIEANGVFVFDRVPPGHYLIRSLLWPGADPERHNPPGIGPPTQQVPIEAPNQAPNAWLSEELVVSNADVAGLEVRARPGARVRGLITLTPELLPYIFSQAWITATSLDGWNLASLPLGRVERDGTFSSPALPPGKYSIVPSGVGNLWFPESATLQDRDVVGSGVEIGERDVHELTVTLSSLKARVLGPVTDNAGRPRPDAHILFFRQNGSWQSGRNGLYGIDVGFQRTNRAGQYDLNLNAGEYFIVALARNPSDVWQDAAFLRSLIPEATKVTLARGRVMTLPLTMRSLPK